MREDEGRKGRRRQRCKGRGGDRDIRVKKEKII